MIQRLSIYCLLLILLGGCGENQTPAAPTAVSPPLAPLTKGGTTPTPTFAPTPTLAPTPAPPTLTPTPLPQQRLTLGSQALAVGNDELAAQQFTALAQQPNALDAEKQQQVLFDLGVTQERNGRFAEAITTLTQLLPSGDTNPDVHFHLAEAYAGVGQHAEAITAYTNYLAAYPDLAAYIQPRIAQSHLALGNRVAAIVAYETAVSAPAHRIKAVALRQTLADLYLADGNHAAAIGQYEAILAVAQTEFTRGQVTYLAGQAAFAAGNEAAGWAWYETAVANYPRAAESYQALIALVEAGREVDDYQRGLIDFHAEAYAPGVEALERHLAAAAPREEAYLLLAWSYEKLGNRDAALQTLARLAAVNPARARLEEGHLLARLGDVAAASSSYDRFLADYPDNAAAAEVAWAAAELAAQAGDGQTAVSRYLALANRYPSDKNAPEALFWAGWLARQQGDEAAALAAWQQGAASYPHAPYGGAAQVWLLRLLPEGEARATLVAAVQAGSGEGYYQLRAQDMVAPGEERPFSAPAPFTLPAQTEDPALQAEAEQWLRDWLKLPAETDVATLDPTLASDPRWRVGQRLWGLGLLEEAKGELESLRQSHSDNPLFCYQLALAFRELGLYRSSIVAAASLQTAAGQPVLALPRFIGRLLYPVYYGDLITTLAQEYGYDPRLQFALVRQESLFESFARSGAAAQGLSQVIPDTGSFIAQQLNWPNYQNDDLYRPYVGLAFGAYYLDLQLDSFDHHPHAALAAYNAGPGNAARWYETAGGDIDVFVETVDFSETRQYIERIYTGFVMYRELYGD